MITQPPPPLEFILVLSHPLDFIKHLFEPLKNSTFHWNIIPLLLQSNEQNEKENTYLQSRETIFYVAFVVRYRH